MLQHSDGPNKITEHSHPQCSLIFTTADHPQISITVQSQFQYTYWVPFSLLSPNISTFTSAVSYKYHNSTRLADLDSGRAKWHDEIFY